MPRSLSPVSLLAPVSLFALGVAASAQTTWVVDDDGPADFATPQEAIDAAADGDTILVRAGFYLSATIDGKGLTLIGEGQPTLQPFFLPAPTASLVVRNLTADQAVYVRGFFVTALAIVEQETTIVDNNAGPVVFESLFIAGGGTAVSVRDCASVTITDSNLIAPATFASTDPFGGFFGFAAYPGLAARDSNVFLYDCSVSGSSGLDSDLAFVTEVPPGITQPGVSLVGSTLLASGCSFRGGNGGSDGLGLCFPGEDGSPALRLSASSQNPAPLARLLDTELLAGVGGTGGCGLADGMDAALTQVDAGSIEDLPGDARSFLGSALNVEGSTIELELEGQPGDTAFLHVQLEAAPGQFLAPFNVALHMPMPTAVVPLGAVGASGDLDLSFPVPNLAPGLDSMRFVGQALFVSSSLLIFDGGPSVVLVTDSGL